MKYALGNMLNGAGGLNADQLALDLQFAADKTLTARKGPSPILTRGSTGTFVGSNGLIQTAAVNAARFDHDPVSPFACRGLLIEEGRTNLLLQSENFGTSWGLVGCSASANTEVSPDGSTTADTINITNAGGHFVVQTVSVTQNTTYTFSFWVKRGTATAMSYSVFNNTSGSNIVAPTSYYSQTSSTWTRVSFTFTTPTGCTSVSVYTLRDSGSTGSVLLWGTQLEAGSFATSYIPTTTSALARSADVCSITGANFTNLWNAAEGTLLVSGDKTMSSAATGSYFTLQAGATEVGPLITRTSTTLLGRIRNNAGTDLTNTDTSQSPTGEKKVAVAWKATSDTADRDYASGGVILVKSNPNAGTAASNQTTMIIGGRPSTAWFNGTISSLRYYKKRLANSKLITLTV